MFGSQTCSLAFLSSAALPCCLAGAPARLHDLMTHVDGAKQRSIIQHMSRHLIPIMEKGLVDCPLVHRRAAPCTSSSELTAGRQACIAAAAAQLTSHVAAPGRLLSEFMQFSPASVVADAAETLSGEPMLHMVHTKVRLWASVLRATRPARLLRSHDTCKLTRM